MTLGSLKMQKLSVGIRLPAISRARDFFMGDIAIIGIGLLLGVIFLAATDDE